MVIALGTRVFQDCLTKIIELCLSSRISLVTNGGRIILLHQLVKWGKMDLKILDEAAVKNKKANEFFNITYIEGFLPVFKQLVF